MPNARAVRGADYRIATTASASKGDTDSAELADQQERPLVGRRRLLCHMDAEELLRPSRVPDEGADLLSPGASRFIAARATHLSCADLAHVAAPEPAATPEPAAEARNPRIAGESWVAARCVCLGESGSARWERSVIVARGRV